jgi:hypothetical protein
VRRFGALLGVVLFAAAALWRAIVAVQHYRLSLATVDDPSIQELEQVSAMIEGGIAVVLLAHAAALFALFRRPLVFSWPLALGVALVCAATLGGAMLGFPLLSIPGVYPATIVVAVAVLSHLLTFGWVSLYLGALVGSVLAWYVASPVLDALVLLFVAAPCVIFAFLGAGLRQLILRLVP